MAYQKDTEKFKGGHVRIYRRREGGNYHARITLPDASGFNHKVGLDTTDRDEARDRATDKYQEFKTLRDRKLPLKALTVRDATKSFLTEQTERAARGELSGSYLYNQKLFLGVWDEYIGDRLLHDLTKRDIDQFDGWRAARVEQAKADGESKFTRVALSKRGLRNYLTTLRTALNHAADHQWIARDQIPLIKAKMGKERRPSFEDRHLTQILDRVHHWQKAAKRPMHKKLRPQYQVFFSFMLATGLRLGEARLLQWKHIQQRVVDGELYDVVKVPASTKTGERECVAIHGTGAWLNSLRLLYRDVWGFEPTDDDYVFCDLDRKKRRKFDHIMHKILAAGGVDRDSNGGMYVIYSTRHTYATQRLLEGADIYTLSKNMGTSVAMIERHYGHVKPLQQAAMLAPNKGLTDSEFNGLLKFIATAAGDNSGSLANLRSKLQSIVGGQFASLLNPKTVEAAE